MSYEQEISNALRNACDSLNAVLAIVERVQEEEQRDRNQALDVADVSEDALNGSLVTYDLLPGQGGIATAVKPSARSEHETSAQPTDVQTAADGEPQMGVYVRLALEEMKEAESSKDEELRSAEAQPASETAKSPEHDKSDAGAISDGYSVEVSAACLSSEKQEDPEDSAAKYAFVSILFGKQVAYCIDALVLGECMRTVGTKHPYILLITSDVPVQWRLVFHKVGWELREVEYLDGDHLYCHGSKGRFAGVFTKLHALNLTEFSKIVLLDLDLLVRTNIDDLFLRPAPSAMRRHASADFVDQELIPSNQLIDTRGHRISGINAGVMVMRPSKAEFEEMLQQIGAQKATPGRRKSGMPEQDFLTRYYRHNWHHLSVCYNYQPHQIAFTDRRGLEKCQRLTVDYCNDVRIVHFSASVKPRDLLINSEYADMTDWHYAQNVLFQQYLQGIDSDRSNRGYSGRCKEAIEAQLLAVTCASTCEWFQHWRILETRILELSFLVDSEGLPGGSIESRGCSRSRSRGRRRS